MRLTERQVELLQWIAEGSPERDWPDWSHRVSAKALASRGLATVRGHGLTWSAEITEYGRRVLDGEGDTTAADAPPRRNGRTGWPAPPVPTREVVDPVGLGAELVAAPDATVRIVNPSRGTRAAYRSAIAAISAGLLPTDKRLTYSGHDHGDFVIRLIDRPAPEPEHPRVPVPEALDLGEPLIAWLNRHPDSLEVSEDARPRALLILQGLVAALSARGHMVAPPRPRLSSPAATCGVTIGDEQVAVLMYEQRTNIRTAPPEEMAQLKYEWQRATTVESWEFNGRLALRIQDGRSSKSWADHQRWTLESRLPRSVTGIEEMAASRRDERRLAADAKQQRRRAWEEALAAARSRHVADLNRQRLEDQLRDFERTSRLRDYAEAIAERAEQMDAAEREDASTWAQWIQSEADRCDPLLRRDAIAFREPKDVRPEDLSKYMPHGFHSSGPPE